MIRKRGLSPSNTVQTTLLPPKAASHLTPGDEATTRLRKTTNSTGSTGLNRESRTSQPNARLQRSTHVTSRQRVIDHGEVFTPGKLVNDMLDLVAHECERIDSRFLEPACGDGNFLAEVLRRRLAVVNQKRFRNINLWEQDALLSLACLYGIELLHDNVVMCRERLLAIFEVAYAELFGGHCRPACVDAARFIVNANILQGDALAMTAVGDDNHPAHALLFTEWSMLARGYFKRRQFEYHQLVQCDDGTAGDLFGSACAIPTDQGRTAFIAQPVRDLPPIHYLKLGSEGQA